MTLIADWSDEVSGRSLGAVVGFIVGSSLTWLLARWRRYRAKRSIIRGDARDTVIIAQHLVESALQPGPDGKPIQVAKCLRIRSVGQAPLDRVIPNGHLAAVFLRRAWRVTAHDTLISMTGAEGSYLLETLMNFVCDRVVNSPFQHDLWVMAPCCETAELAEHQPITILLIPVRDLALFDSWPLCRDIHVEHGSDGSRVLTLMEMARRFRKEQNSIAAMRAQGKRTRHVESMYVLDLALDPNSAPIPTKPVPWGRYEEVLKKMNLE